MIQHFKITRLNDSELILPFIDIEIPEITTVRVMGINFNLSAIEYFTAEDEKIIYSSIGKLENLIPQFSKVIIPKLRAEFWDFDTYPDPEVFLIEQAINSVSTKF